LTAQISRPEVQPLQTQRQPSATVCASGPGDLDSTTPDLPISRPVVLR
jgi:hypothetical protein